MVICGRCRRTYDDAVRFCPLDGSAVASVAARGDDEDPYLGKVLMGQFEIRGLAGRGAMGTVYRAEQTTMGRTVAVKILLRDLLKEASVVKRFLREARAAARLSHPNIVTVHLVGETDEGVPYIVMEYVDGGSLDALIEKELVISPRRAIHITRQIASALSEAHGHGIIHRDLKPDNILLLDRKRAVDHVKVLDFGIAKILRAENESSGLTRDGSIFGTPYYISPEQAAGQEVDARADVYSLGVILFRMTTGRLPFEGGSGMQIVLRHMREAPPRPSALRPGLPQPLEDLILAAMEKDRGDRIQDSESFIERLGRVEAQLGDEGAQTLHGLAPVSSVASGPTSARRAPGQSSPRPEPGRDARSPAASPSASPAGAPVATRGEPVAPARPRLRSPGPDEWVNTAAPTVVITGQADDDPSARVTDRRPISDEETVGPDDDLEADERPATRSRAALWISLGAMGLGATAGLLYATRGESGPPQGARSASPPRDAGPPAGPGATAALIEEHVVKAGAYTMRVGFDEPPVEGTRAILRIGVGGERGPPGDARVEVTLRPPGTHEELIPSSVDPVAADGSHRAEIGFRVAGRHHLRVILTPLGGGEPLRAAFDFDVAGPHAEATSLVAPPTARMRPGRHAGPGAFEPSPDTLAPVVIPPSAPAVGPLAPHVIGGGGPPSSPPGPAAPPPPTVTPHAVAAPHPAAAPAHFAPPPRAVEPAPPATIEEAPAEGDPYRILDHAK